MGGGGKGEEGGARPVVGMPRPAIGFTPLHFVHQLPLSLLPISSKSLDPSFTHLRHLNFPTAKACSFYPVITAKANQADRQAEPDQAGWHNNVL